MPCARDVFHSDTVSGNFLFHFCLIIRFASLLPICHAEDDIIWANENVDMLSLMDSDEIEFEKVLCK